MTGLSLANGGGYSLANEPGEAKAVQYPPGLPAVVAVVAALAPQNDPSTVGHLMRLLYMAMHVGVAIGTYVIATRHVSRTFALGAAILIATCPLVIFFSNILQTELPYMATCVLYIALAGSRSARDRSGLLEVVLFLLGMYAVALRVIGVALPLARAGSCLARSNWRGFAVATCAAVLSVALWQAYVSRVKTSDAYLHPTYEYQRASYNFYNVGYFENIAYRNPFVPELGRADLAEYARRVLANTRVVLIDVPSSFIASPKNVVSGLGLLGVESGAVKALVSAAAVAIGLAIWLGLAILAIGRSLLIPGFVLLSLAAMSSTPWPEQINRYLLPLGPLFAISAMVVAQKLATLGGTLRRSVVYPAVVALFVVLPLLFNVVGNFFFFTFLRPAEAAGLYSPEDRLFTFEQSWKGQNAASAWLKENSGPNEIVATSTPQWTFLISGRRSVMPPFEADPDKAQRLLDGVPARYLMIDTFQFIDVSRRYAQKAIDAHPDLWRRVYTSSDGATSIFRREEIKVDWHTRQYLIKVATAPKASVAWPVVYRKVVSVAF